MQLSRFRPAAAQGLHELDGASRPGGVGLRAMLALFVASAIGGCAGAPSESQPEHTGSQSQAVWGDPGFETDGVAAVPATTAWARPRTSTPTASPCRRRRPTPASVC